MMEEVGVTKVGAIEGTAGLGSIAGELTFSYQSLFSPKGQA
jgi:hypothetical protein